MKIKFFESVAFYATVPLNDSERAEALEYTECDF